jgi:hypothetical protein
MRNPFTSLKISLKYLILVTSFIFLSNSSFAGATASQCYFDNTLGDSWNIYTGGDSIKIFNSTPIGTVLAARGITVRGVYTGKTGEADTVRIKGSWISGGVGGGLADYYTVATNIPGIGLRWRYSSSSTANGILPRNAVPIILAEEAAEPSAVGTGAIQLATVQELILTGNASSGVVTNTPGAATNFIIDAVNSAGVASRICNATGDFGDKYTLNLDNVPIQNTCEIDTCHSSNDGLFQYDRFSFYQLTFPARGNQFSIRLNNCPQPNQAFILSILTIAAIPATYLAYPHNRFWCPTGSSHTIRLKLLANNQTIRFGTNNSYSMGSASGSMVEMPLQADYIRTGAVTAGHGNAVEFFIDYP